MTPQDLKEIMMPVVELLTERIRELEVRVVALESQPGPLTECVACSALMAPLNWPTLDPIAPYEPVLYRKDGRPHTRDEFFATLATGLTDAAPTPSDRQGFEPREYCERN